MSFWPRRIACLTAEATEIVFSLGAGDRVVGISGYCVRPEEARQKPKVAAFTSIRLDKIKALQPDLLIGFSNLQKDIARDLVAEGYNVFISNQRTLEETADTMLAIGRLIGCEKEGRALRENFLAELERLASVNSLKSKPSVYFEEWDEPMISGIRWVSELIELLGGRDIFREKSFSQSAKERVLQPEEVLSAKPDVILASWCGKKVNFEKIRSRVGWEEIPAVKNHQLYEIKSPDILAPGPSLLHGARQMAEIFKNFSASLVTS